MTAVLDRPVAPPSAPGSVLGLTLAAKYMRISDDPEGLELGVERQSDDLDAFAAQNRLYYVDTYCDNDVGASTRTKKSKTRDEYVRMLKDAKDGRFQVIAAYTSSRITRRPRENEDLIELAEQFSIRYKYIRSPEHDLNTADGRMVCRWLAAADTGESERIAERVSRAARQRAEKGEFNGGARPFGYGVQKTLNGMPLFDEDTGKPVLDYSKVVESEAAEIRRAADALLAGASLKGIARDWNERGVLTTLGNKWTGSTVSEMMRRPRLAGLKVYKGHILEGAGDAPWEPILKRDTWEALALKLGDSSRRKSPGNKPRHLLTMANCGHRDCVGKGHKMRFSNKSEKSKTTGVRKVTPMYRCQALGHNWINAIGLDHMIIGLALQWLEQPQNAGILAATDNTAERGKALSAEAALLRERLASFKRMLIDGVLSEDEFRTMKPEVEEKLAAVEAQLADLNGTTPLRGIAGNPDAAAIWADLDLDRRKAIVDTLMEITITSSTSHGGRLPVGELLDKTRVHIEWKV